MPAKATLAQALATHRALPKDVGLGLVPTDKGFAIRCRSEHQATVALAARPDDAKAYGDSFALAKEESRHFWVRGVDAQITGPVLLRSLQHALQWTVKPVKPVRAKSGWGINDWLVWAKEAPRQQLVCLTTSGGRAMRVEINEVVPVTQFF